MKINIGDFVGYQPRYIAYCRANGNTPQAQDVADRQLWPGGLMCGFILWTQNKWREWQKETGRADLNALTTADHDAFDAWLINQAITEAEKES